jgi:4-hydroxy-3-polyprenylbenzoate decarboxylase
MNIETHLVMSNSAEKALATESKRKLPEVHALATVVHSVKDIGASISSGSFKTDGMVIAPCSIRTLSEIATGVTSSLLTRAADVVLKERRKLVLLVRETPLHTGHLKTMTRASEIGAIIFPPVPAFYSWPNSIEDIVDQTVGRVLDMMDVDNHLVQRWGEPNEHGKTIRAFPIIKT